MRQLAEGWQVPGGDRLFPAVPEWFTAQPGQLAEPAEVVAQLEQ